LYIHDNQCCVGNSHRKASSRERIKFVLNPYYAPDLP
jgi:hypothetical protein